jgi:hypothetical protein
MNFGTSSPGLRSQASIKQLTPFPKSFSANASTQRLWSALSCEYEMKTVGGLAGSLIRFALYGWHSSSVAAGLCREDLVVIHTGFFRRTHLPDMRLFYTARHYQACCMTHSARYALYMLRAHKPHTPPDDELLDRYANHYTITATCPCGHSRELFARPIQTMLGKGVLFGKVRDALRCHKCQRRRPNITVTRMPR